MGKFKWVAACAIATGTVGCGDEPERRQGLPPGYGGGLTLGDDGGDGGETDGGDEGMGAESSAGAAGSEDGGGPEGEGRTLAEGIQIVDVEVNQAVAVRVATAGQPIAAAQRQIGLVGNRTSLVRATWALDAGSPSRAIEAQLTLTGPDGVAHEFSDERIVDGAATLDSEDASFEWQVPAEQFPGDSTYEIRMYEVGSSGPGLPPSSPFPPTASAELGVDASLMRMQIVFMPLQTPGSPALTPDFQQRMQARLEATYPVQGVGKHLMDSLPHAADVMV